MKHLVVLFLLVGGLFAGNIAIIKDVKGEVLLQTQAKMYALKDGDMLKSDMIIRTKQGSAVIVFNDNSVAILAPYSILNLEKFVFEPAKNHYAFELFLKKGSLSFESGKIGDLAPEKFILKTPEGMVSIRGTKFLVRVK